MKMSKGFLKMLRGSSVGPYSRVEFSKKGSNWVNKFNGKVALVTASTEGIGFSVARRLAQDGAKVMICSRKQQNVDKALQELRDKGGFDVSGIVCHIGKDGDRKDLVKETLEKYNGIDILVSNAAVNPTFGSILDVTEESWDKIFDINVKSAFLLSKEVVPHIRDREGGSITFISSLAGLVPFPFIGAYSVSKTALIGLTKALSVELANDNIRVNCVAPGIVKTKFASALTENDMIADTMLAQTPLKRFASPDEISGIVSFLCSNDASYMTGETIVAAGGATSRL